MLPAAAILELHDRANALWHDDAGDDLNTDDPFARAVLHQHQANFELWHEEDLARDPGAPDSVIAAVKHSIDRLNQRRNDLIETLDRNLLAAAPAEQSGTLHSETPGMMIDRLSILSLKIFHTAEEIVRPDATEEHRGRNRDRLALLHEQRDDLAAALDGLWAEVLAGTRRFRLYRGMKMYNDPTLNPVLYRGASPARA